MLKALMHVLQALRVCYALVKKRKVGCSMHWVVGLRLYKWYQISPQYEVHWHFPGPLVCLWARLAVDPVC